MQHDFILLDRSGSMTNHWSETLGALNGYVKGLADKNVDTGVTLITFDKDITFDKEEDNISFDVIRDRITPATWKNIDSRETFPRGYTPLNDAVGKLVARAKEGFNGVQYEKVAIIIVTDGMENASKEFPGKVGTEKIKALLNECRAKNWQVIFLGADFDNTAQAVSLGAAHQDFAQVHPEKASFVSASLSASRSVYGSSGKSMGFTDEEKITLKQK